MEAENGGKGSSWFVCGVSIRIGGGGKRFTAPAGGSADRGGGGKRKGGIVRGRWWVQQHLPVFQGGVRSPFLGDG